MGRIKCLGVKCVYDAMPGPSGCCTDGLRPEVGMVGWGRTRTASSRSSSAQAGLGWPLHQTQAPGAQTATRYAWAQSVPPYSVTIYQCYSFIVMPPHSLPPWGIW